jgi:hypothetical protein
MVTFTNPRLVAEFNDWPMGGNKRGYCVFKIEHNSKRGYRHTRQTTGKLKTATFGGKGAIVDGDDGRTYLIQFAGLYDFINVWKSDFPIKVAGEQVTGKAGGGIFREDARYEELKALIMQANA